MIDRRSILTSALLASALSLGNRALSAKETEASRQQYDHDMSMMPASWTQPDQIAMLCYPGMTILDLIGPHYMFTGLMGATVHLVAKTRDPVKSDAGITVIPTATFDEVPRDLTVLFSPGGSEGTLAAMRDEKTRAFMADRGSRARYVTSVCTGSLVLGAAGLLKGYKATSHWGGLEALTAFGATPVDARVVKDRNRITGAGVTAGLDFGLQMAAELRDPTYAQGLQLMCEYDPQPPYNSGSLRTAPPEVVALMKPMLVPFAAQATAIADELKLKR